jgi:two-component system, NarL family, response regulator LiaR
MKTLIVVEDDPDVQLLLETIFSMDARFGPAEVAVSAQEALAVAERIEPGIIVLDHGLEGTLTGLEAAPRLKELAPNSKIILFTAHAELKARAAEEPSIDAFLLQTKSTLLLALAQRLTGLDPSTPETQPHGVVPTGPNLGTVSSPPGQT